MTAWRWVRADVLYAVHEIQLAQHGGLDGIRNKDAVESALARPEQLASYGEPAPDAADLAAAYAYGLARSHGFSDGNKRTAWVAARIFLADNGLTLKVAPAEAIHIMKTVAAGGIEEKQLAEWLRQRILA